MPLATLQRLVELAQHGAEVIFQKFPEDVPGLKNLEIARQQRLVVLKNLPLSRLADSIKGAKIGDGEIVLAEKIGTALEYKEITRETLVDAGLSYIRRKSEAGVY